MIKITKNIYEEVLRKLVVGIGESNYISTRTITGSFDDVEYKFIITAVIYRDDFKNISEIIPVWWDFRTEIDGVEKMNDFLFSEMCKLI